MRDGSLERVRYTGKKLYKPIGFEVLARGLRIDFTEALDRLVASDLGRFFVQQWNYEYANRYGSPEFSLRHPESLGHDPVAVAAVRLSEDCRSLFLDLPTIIPAMQMHVRMHLKAADGTDFKAEIFPTILQVPGQEASLALRIRKDVSKSKKPSSARGKVDRRLRLNCLSGLLYDKKKLRAKAGERIALTLVNDDAMPHNVVIVQPGSGEKVGMASLKMLNDPKAGDRHYIPDLPEVVAYSHVVQPGGKYTVTFTLPEKPGIYPYLCTFPGHFQVMKGELSVE